MNSRSQRPHGLRRGSAAARLLLLGSNYTGGMDICLLQLLYAARYKSLRPADHSSGGVLPSVVCLMSVITKPPFRGGHDTYSGRRATRGRGGMNIPDSNLETE